MKANSQKQRCLALRYNSFNAKRQIKKLWIVIFESLVLPDSELYRSRQLLKQLLSSLGHLSCYLSSQYNKNAKK